MAELILETIQEKKRRLKEGGCWIFSNDEDDQTQEESEIEEIKISGDGNITEEQKKLGINIEMIGARK